jgi:hypothetical protein
MNFVTSTWRELVRRRLWPVAVLLLLALVAVPVVLAHDPQPAETPAPGPVAATKADDSVATPVVAKAAAADRDRRRRVLGARKDPFKPAPVKTPAPTAEQTQAAVPSSSGGSSALPSFGGSSAPDSSVTQIKPPSLPVTGSGGGSAPGTPSPLPSPTGSAPAGPTKPTYPADSVIVRFGDAKSDSLEQMLVPKLAPLGKSEASSDDDGMSLLVYLGLTKDGKKAKFLIDDSLRPTGDGVCKPHPSTCEVIELRKGDTEFFDTVDPKTNEIASTFELDLVAINRKS